MPKKTTTSDTCTCCVIIGTILIMILLCILCDKEFFTDVSEFFTDVSGMMGYPRPQGNLSNFLYGTKVKVQDTERKQWDGVLNKKRKEKFVIPRSNTII